MSLSDVLAIAGLCISVIGIPVTFIVARRTRQIPDLRYVTEFDILLDPSDKIFDAGLSLSLGGVKLMASAELGSHFGIKGVMQFTIQTL